MTKELHLFYVEYWANNLEGWVKHLEFLQENNLPTENTLKAIKENISNIKYHTEKAGN